MNKHLRHNLRFTVEQYQEIEDYCKRHNIDNKTTFFKYAISQTLRPDIEDPELVFSSLSQLHNTLNKVSRQQEILFSYIGFLFRNLLAYHPEIPENLKAAASVSAQERFERAFKTYQESLKQTPSMFESLLADYFEEA